MEKEKQSISFNSVIFRAYDIRGVFGEELTCEVVHEIAKAIGTVAQKQNQQEIVVGREGRLSSPELNQVLIEGLLSTGMDIIDIGIVRLAQRVFHEARLKIEAKLPLKCLSADAPQYDRKWSKKCSKSESLLVKKVLKK